MTFKQSPPGFQNVRGPLIQSVQAQLNAKGFNAGTVDGVWGDNTMRALRAWQSANGINPSGEIDDQTWAQLTASAVPDLSQRALQLTGDWEGTGYTGANGNFDGQGITWGVVGFTWGNSELQRILGEVRALYPAIFTRAFGNLEPQIVNILGQPLASQMAWARSISTNGGDKIAPQWAAAFKALGAASEVQQIENHHAQHYWDAGAQLAANFRLQSEAGLALCFDIAVQNKVTHDLLADIQRTIGSPGMSEADKMRAIAHVVASHANPKYYTDVLTRKMAFVTGQGAVHGARYDITCWGIG